MTNQEQLWVNEAMSHQDEDHLPSAGLNLPGGRGATLQQQEDLKVYLQRRRTGRMIPRHLIC